MKKFNLRENITEVLAVITMGGSITFLLLVCFKAIPSENKDLVNLAVGFIVGTPVSGVIGYYFGTSKNRNVMPTEPGTSVTSIQKSIISEAEPK